MRKILYKRNSCGFAAGLLIAGIGLGCRSGPLETVRAATYPADFHYITKQEIRTTMGGLASEVYALDQIMLRESGVQQDDQARVIEILSRMRNLAKQLKRQEQSNHPRIQAHAPRLQRDIDRALANARRAPPNYYYTGLVTSTCTYCHAQPVLE